MAHWTIDAVSIAGGFLSDFSARLSAGMVCVIGPRGSGKSTFAEALRVALGGIPQGITKPRQEFIKATLGGAVLTVTTAPWPDRGAITVRRVVGQDPSVSGADGRPISTIELDRGTFLPIDAYSGPEIEAIADENIGGRRKALLDDLSQDLLQPIKMALADQGRSLEANAEAILAAQRRIANLTEQMEELRDARSALEALPPSGEKEASPEFQDAAAQRAKNEKEGKRLADALAAIRKCAEDIAAAVGAAEAALSQAITIAVSKNAAVTRRMDALVGEAVAALKRLASEAGGIASGAADSLRAEGGDLSARHAEQESEYARQQDLNTQAVQAYERRSAAERSVAALDGLTKQRTAAEQELAALIAARRELKTEYVLTRERVSEVREKVAEQLQSQAGKKVRIRVQRNADDLHYLDFRRLF